MKGIEKTFFKQYPFQQGILITKHQTLIGCRTVILLQTLQLFLMSFDCRLQLFNVLGSPLSKRRLGLSIALLSLL